MGAAVSRFYKNKFQRIRPWQLAGELGIDINHMKFPSDTMQTPSYPSGHSVQSRLVAEHYIEIYPQHKKGLVAAAEECGLSRVKAGWHPFQLALIYPYFCRTDHYNQDSF